ncbi:MAG: bifunctional hydroxymethylpyrimidine kinase/phosphomethylpyrimidine kinase [Candidatus Bathyarchaeia archaeon]
MKVPRALTIAGSDSGGGAGVQADLKTFASLGVYGMTAVTAITAQNTRAVTGVQGISPEIVKAQIEAVVEDIGVDAAKTGMLYSPEIICTVAEQVKKHVFPLVVDPVMISKSGAPLLKKEAVDVLVRRLIPMATIVTPNIMEAEALSGFKIESLKDVERAAEQICRLGAGAVVVKGGHMGLDKVYDTLYCEGKCKVYEGERIMSKNTHGTGCAFSAAIAAYMAKGETVEDAVKKAKEFISQAIRFAYPVGKGFGPVNPMAPLYREAEKYAVLTTVEKAVEMLEKAPKVASLIPESQSNIAMALSHAASTMDVAAIPGRIVRLQAGVKASSHPTFGASKHVANTILVAVKHNPEIRSAMNIKYSKRLISLCESLGMAVSSYDRKLEPLEVKEKEGMTTIWGAEEAIKKLGKVPDVIYHQGDYGKEPMTIILGKDAVDVAKRVVQLSQLINP